METAAATPVASPPLLVRLLAEGLRWLLGGLFVWAGLLKLADPRAFAVMISHYHLVPHALLPLVALSLPLLEVLAGAALILRLRGGLPALTALLLLFLGVLWFGILQDLEIDCGCFSLAEQAEHTTLRQAFSRDLLMLAAAAGLWGERWRYCHPRPLWRCAIKRQEEQG